MELTSAPASTAPHRSGFARARWRWQPGPFPRGGPGAWIRHPVVIATALGLAIRVGFVLSRPNWPAHGDAYFYHAEANLLVEGKGWINPFLYNLPGHPHVATAAFPPLFTLVLAASSLVGFKTFFAHRMWCALIGAAAIPLGAWVGWDMIGRGSAGRRVAVLAAFGIAVYPNLWMSDGLGMSESLSPILILLVLAAAYRMWRAPSWPRAAFLGVTPGLAALGRDELALLVPLVLLPLALTRRASWAQRGKMLGAGLIAAGLVVGPVVGYNLTRFDKPVFISDGFGVTLASANCDTTWHGVNTGYWSLPCAVATHPNPHADEAVQGNEEEHAALTYIRDHLGGLPKVELARLGRAFGVYRPVTQINADVFLEGRPKTWAFVGLGMYYGLAVLAVPGAFVLRKRRITILPLVAVLADVVVSVLLTFGQTRYRSTLEPVLVLLAAVAVGTLLGERRRGRPRSFAAAPPSGVAGRDALVVVPALNEEPTVAEVVHRVRSALPEASVLVVDDGSSDATAVLARAAGADVMVCPFTLGVGAAMRVGFRYAAARGYRAVVQVDGDGQHEPADLPLLLRALDSGERPHIVIGTRFQPDARPIAAEPGARPDAAQPGACPPPVPRVRRIAMKALAAYVSWRTGAELDDVTSGFRAHNRAAIDLFARWYPAEYLSDTVESLIIAHQAECPPRPGPGAHVRPRSRPAQPVDAAVGRLSRAGQPAAVARPGANSEPGQR